MNILNLFSLFLRLGIMMLLFSPHLGYTQSENPYSIKVFGQKKPSDTLTLIIISPDSCTDTLVYYQPQDYSFPCTGPIHKVQLLGDHHYLVSVIEDTFQGTIPLEIHIFVPGVAFPTPTYGPYDPPYILAPVFVWGFPSLAESHRSLVKQDAFSLSDQSSMITGINLVPGVKMDQRGPGGSARLSVRGSLLRSTFGMRGIKTYWEDLPISSPDGTTPIELFDPWVIGSLEIAKGPAGGSGIGTAGVFKLNGWRLNHPHFPRKWFEVNLEGGSWGYQRMGARLHIRNPKNYYTAEYVRQRVKGYREQEANGKDLLKLSANHSLGEKLNLNSWIMAYRGYWELPGALDSLSMASDPRQAVPASVDANAGIIRDRLLGGVTLKYPLKGQERILSGGILGQITQKENPYGTTPVTSGYKMENGGNWAAVVRYQANSGAARPVPFLRKLWGPMVTTSNWFQAEWQLETNHLKDHENLAGSPGALQVDDRTNSYTGMVGAGYDLIFSKGWRIGTKAHGQYLRYNIQDLFSSDTINYSGNTTYPTQFLPAATLRFPLFHRMSMSFIFQTGFSPPANWEIAPPEGIRNNSLKPEKAQSFEVGYHLPLWKEKVRFDAFAYQQTTQGFIQQQRNPAGLPYFANIGKVVQRGLEAKLVYNSDGAIMENPRKYFLLGLAVQDFRKIESAGSQTFQSGNRLVGVPFFSASMAGVIWLKRKFSVSINANTYSRIPLNDEFTHFAKAYTLLGSTLRYRKGLYGKGRGRLEPYLGGSNLLNMRYSSFLNLNAFGDKFYNPSPTRSFFAGISFIWR